MVQLPYYTDERDKKERPRKSKQLGQSQTNEFSDSQTTVLSTNPVNM